MLSIAITGRPNVGKSTFFNRIAGKKLALVHDTPGLTRDWRETEGFFYDQPVRLIDTAGLEEASGETIEARMRKQTEAAINLADVIIFMIDGRAGLTPLDEHFATWLRQQNKPVVLVVNKCEHEAAAQAGLAEAYKLGLGEPVAVSSAHGFGIEDVYHALKDYFPSDQDESDESDMHEGDTVLPSDLDSIEGDENFAFIDREAGTDSTDKPIKIAIAGRPNVGKSTLLNAVVRDERVMTGPEAGVTRDAIAVDWEFRGQKYKLVDTAGLRRKSKVMNQIERMAVDDSMRAIRLAQIVIMVIDGQNGLEKQDLTIAQHIVEEGRAVVLAVNKWDQVTDKEDTLRKLSWRLHHSLSQISNIPIVTLSALQGRNIGTLLRSIQDTYKVWNARVPTGRLNRWLASRYTAHPPPLVQKRPNRLRYITQIKARPPTFALWVSRPDDLPDSYQRYLINGIREDFGLDGVPIRLLLRTSKNPYHK